ncbi:M48 family metallopeptidase [Luteimonas aquatica]|uniref:M48 family metallopeptidase n=1 Tax=Luteimonas aquatica TaxID=450364 RepID=UPI001F5905DB|nr:SprT family zinc-dependent metalloprotease [Luteimonas aquatica]
MSVLSRLLTRPPRTVERDTVPFLLEDGRTVEVLRVRDPRARRLRLSVDERGARLTLPPRASLISGERFLREHRDWLVRQLATHAHVPIPPLVRGEPASLPLRGQALPLRWREGRFARVLREDDGLVLELPARAGEAAQRRALRDFFETEARADVARWLPRYLPALPRAPARIRVKPMSSQWGSLAPNGILALDLALVLGRAEAFEYVLVHELCHLIHADHSRAFWREVEGRCPAWREERTYFHAEGRRLKATLRALIG